MVSKFCVILCVIFASFVSHAGPDGLQNEDFKSLLDLTTAGGSISQLLNDTKLYLTGGSLNKQLSTAINDGTLVAAGIPLTTKGDLLTRSASVLSRLPAGTDGYSLIADSTQALGLRYANVIPLAAKGDLLTSTGSAVVVLPVGTDGYVLTADSAQTDGIRWAPSGAGTFSVPQVTTLTSGSGSYTVPVGALYLEVEMCAGGGGGAAADSQATGAANGNATLFGTATVGAGGAGQFTGAGGGGGVANASGYTAIKTMRGNTGMPSMVSVTAGTMYFARGGAGPWGGSPNDVNGNTYAANSCSGGSSGASTTSPGTRGAGGGAGGYSHFYVPNPVGPYSWTVGAGGAGATGTSNGLNGSDGRIIVIAHFQ